VAASSIPASMLVEMPQHLLSLSKHGLYQLCRLAGMVGAVRIARSRRNGWSRSSGPFLLAERDSVAVPDQWPPATGSTTLATTGR
jgi:hypothetical protein